MTEDEAKQKTCPTMRYLYNEAGVIHYRDPAIYVQSNCIGSACMAWREVRVPMEQDHEWDDTGAPKQIVRGYCGLAGAPQ